MRILLDSAQLATEVQTLPPMVPSLLRLTELVGSGEYSLADVEHLIHFDQGLTLDTLRLANSVPLAAHVRIGSVREAVVRLGAERISHYLFSRWLGGAVSVPLRSYGIDAGRFWTHGVIIGLACEKRAQLQGMADAGLAFTAGLLHDFGKLVLDHFAMRMRIEVDWCSVPDTEALLEAEELVFGTDHRQIGAAVMRNWNFPEAIIQASTAIQGGAWDSSLIGFAHRIDAWVVAEDQGEGDGVILSADEQALAIEVRREYEAVRTAVGVE